MTPDGTIAELGRILDARKARIEELEARLSRAVEALASITKGADRLGGDCYGGSECPWCGADDGSDQAWHNADCTLVNARAVLSSESKGDR